MAWINVTPTSGQGNGTISVTCEATTGRSNRLSTIKATATSSGAQATCSCTQQGVGLQVTVFKTPVTIPSSGERDVTVLEANAGGPLFTNAYKLDYTATITTSGGSTVDLDTEVGKSRFVQIYYSTNSGGTWTLVPESGIVPNDPGATSPYLYKFTFPFATDDISWDYERTIYFTLQAWDENSNKETVELTVTVEAVETQDDYVPLSTKALYFTSASEEESKIISYTASKLWDLCVVEDTRYNGMAQGYYLPTDYMTFNPTTGGATPSGTTGSTITVTSKPMTGTGTTVTKFRLRYSDAGSVGPEQIPEESENECTVYREGSFQLMQIDDISTVLPDGSHKVSGYSNGSKMRWNFRMTNQSGAWVDADQYFLDYVTVTALDLDAYGVGTGKTIEGIIPEDKIVYPESDAQYYPGDLNAYKYTMKIDGYAFEQFSYSFDLQVSVANYNEATGAWSDYETMTILINKS